MPEMSIPLSSQVHPVLAGGTFAILTGDEPKYPPAVQGGHKALLQELAQTGLKHEPTQGHHDGATGPAVVLYGPTREQAMETARKFGQESVVFSDGGQHQLIYVNGPNAGKFHPAAGQEFFANKPQGSSTNIPGAGYVRFHFDHGNLLDVPKKALSPEGTETMSDQKKSQVTVSDFRKALAKSIQAQIDKFSKSLVDLRDREVKASEDSIVAEFSTAESDFSISTNCPVCGQKDAPGSCLCLVKTEVVEGNLKKSHFGLAAGVAAQKVADSYYQNVASKMGLDEAQARQLASKVAADWASKIKDPKAIYEMALGHAPEDYAATATAPAHPEDPDSFGPPSTVEKAEPLAKPMESQAQARAMHAAAQGQSNIGIPQSVGKEFVEASHGQKVGKLPEKKKTKKAENVELEKEGVCKACKSEMCKCMEKSLIKPNFPSNAPVVQSTIQKVSEAARARMAAASTQAAADEQARAALAAKGHNVAIKSEDFIDLKNANAKPATSKEAAAGGKRIKNVGAENPDPAPPSKDVPGKLDEGSGGTESTGKGYKLGKEEVAPGVEESASGTEEEGVDNVVKAALGASAKPPPPPTAKPPSGQSGKLKVSKPMAPKTGAPKMGKAALPPGLRSPAGAADAAAHAAKTGALKPAPAAPKLPSPDQNMARANELASFTPPGKFTRSEKEFGSFVKSLGSCALCGKAEHKGGCES